MQPTGTTITCPNCGQNFSAILEQIVDANRNPQAKARLLNGELNALTCPNCGFQFTAHTPLIYHDASKELLITYVPMELNLPQDDQERILGQLQQTLVNNLPSEERRGYMFTPKNALTLQSLVEQILEADGVTPEMREAHQARLELIDMLMETPEDQLATTIRAHDEDIDSEFFQTLNAAVQIVARRGQQEQYNKMAMLYDALMQHSTAGQELALATQTQEEALEWAREKLQAFGEDVSREQLVDLLLEIRDDQNRVTALASLVWPLLDYQFFQLLTERMESAPDDEKTEIEALRNHLTELTTIIEQQNRAAMEQSADTLRALLQAPDLDEALAQHLGEIDEMFMSVLVANLQAAERAQDITATARLREIYDRVVALIQSQSPPEVQFLNALLNSESESEVEELLDSQAGKFGPELLELMDVLIDDLKQGGQPETSNRLSELRGQVEAAVTG